MPTLSSCTLSRGRQRRSSRTRTTSANPERLPLPHRVRRLRPHLSALRTLVVPNEDLRQHPRQREEQGQTQPSTAILREALRRHRRHAKLRPLQDHLSRFSEHLLQLRKQESLRIFPLHHQTEREHRPTLPIQGPRRHHAHRRRQCPTKLQREASSACHRPSQATAYPQALHHHPQVVDQFHHPLQQEILRPRPHHCPRRHRQPRHHPLFTAYHHPRHYRRLRLVLLHLQAQHQFPHLYLQQAM